MGLWGLRLDSQRVVYLIIRGICVVAVIFAGSLCVV